MSIKIPKKCNEPWDGMSPTADGKFCSTCNLEVIDFTDWKTEDIISYVQESSTKVCGRISRTQSAPDYKLLFLNTQQLSRFGFGLALSGLLFTQSLAAESHVIDTTGVHLQHQQNLRDSITIQGVVTDQSGRPLAEVAIRNLLTNELFKTDKEGRFIFKFPSIYNLKSLPLLIVYIGYKRVNINHNLLNNENINVKLEEDIQEIGEVIIEPLRRKPRTDVKMSKHRTKQ
ncbi:carboxypeptidase-like regulatory domain-containing protein [Sphingobacterium tabacisoli]|uniref:Carboxypeptidase-like regulatory domain-containing protein n=1 Tax=Sphingobacterium tabacisoli TaxID=2044855 RepID=A0ABW5L1B8_9SPHI|nr:carboxypeptidase-like regulatory domain-containing protein [Sphingobacterium tabacisoli]